MYITERNILLSYISLNMSYVSVDLYSCKQRLPETLLVLCSVDIDSLIAEFYL
jgi:hypothetical protein